MICAWTVDDKWDKMIHGKNKKQYMRIIIKEKYMNRSHWIWYPGDFEIYHGMMQNFSREERGFIWPAYYQENIIWKKKRRLRCMPTALVITASMM